MNHPDDEPVTTYGIAAWTNMENIITLCSDLTKRTAGDVPGGVVTSPGQGQQVVHVHVVRVDVVAAEVAGVPVSLGDLVTRPPHLDGVSLEVAAAGVVPVDVRLTFLGGVAPPADGLVPLGPHLLEVLMLTLPLPFGSAFVTTGERVPFREGVAADDAGSGLSGALAAA